MNNKVTVEILGVKYPLRYSKDSDINDIQEAAKIVDENIRLMTKQNQYLPPDRVAVLTALQIAEQLIRLKKDYNDFWDILDENRSNKHKLKNNMKTYTNGRHFNGTTIYFLYSVYYNKLRK